MNIQKVAPERYKLGPLLGDAGQSFVYDSQDLQTGERVVVKYIERRNGAISAGLTELSALLALDHPNLVSCLDFHYLENGATMIVHEFVEGGSLRDYLEEGKAVSSEIWLKCAQDLLAGLAHLHQKKLIHRDLKPENILVQKGKNGEALLFKIADLGLAQFKRDAARAGRAGSGSPAYMAPEAFNGSTSVSSDLYAVGVILYEMAAGCRPFTGGIKTLARAHAHTVPDLNRIQIEGVAAFINALLHKNQRNRFQSAVEAQFLLSKIKSAQIEFSAASELVTPLKADTNASSITSKIQQLDRFEFITEFYLDSLAATFELLEVNGQPVIAAIHRNHIELFDGRTGKPFNRFISKIGDQLQILQSNTLITSDASNLYRWSGDFRNPEVIAQLGQSTLNSGLSSDESFIIWAEGTRVFFRSLIGDEKLHLVDCTNAGFSARFIYPEAGGSFVLIPGTAQPLAQWFDLAGNACGDVQLDGPIIDAARIQLPAVLTCPTSEQSQHALSLVFFSEKGQTVTLPIDEVPRFHSFCNDGLVYGKASGSVLLCTKDGETHHLGETGDMDSILIFAPSRNFFYSMQEIGHRRKFQLYTTK